MGQVKQISKEQNHILCENCANRSLVAHSEHLITQYKIRSLRCVNYHETTWIFRILLYGKKTFSRSFTFLIPLSIGQWTYCFAQNDLEGNLTRILNQKLKSTWYNLEGLLKIKGSILLFLSPKHGRSWPWQSHPTENTCEIESSWKQCFRGQRHEKKKNMF